MRLLLAALCACLGTAALPGADQPADILNVYDAFGKPEPGMEFGWGYSALIRYHGSTILFDAGGDAARFGRNAQALGIDLNRVDYAVLSHAHGDHTSGFDTVFEANPRLKLYVPADRDLAGTPGLRLPEVPRETAEALPPELRYFGGVPREWSGPWGSRFWKARTELVPGSREIAPGVFLVATRSLLMGNFSRAHADDTPALEGIPELSLALVTARGIVVVAGCSHSGIENIVRQAKKDTGRDVDLVAGGFHLLPLGALEIRILARTMKNDLRVRRVAPAHCTGMEALRAFRDVFGGNFLAAGLASRIAFEP